MCKCNIQYFIVFEAIVMEQINTLRLFTGTFIDPVIFRDKYAEVRQYFGDIFFGKILTKKY